MPPDIDPAFHKRAVQQETADAIRRQNTLWGIPRGLSGLLAVIPAGGLFLLLDHHHVSRTITTVVALVVYWIIQLVLGLYFRSILRRHPDMNPFLKVFFM